MAAAIPIALELAGSAGVGAMLAEGAAAGAGSIASGVGGLAALGGAGVASYKGGKYLGHKGGKVINHIFHHGGHKKRAAEADSLDDGQHSMDGGEVEAW